ncbi:MAG: (E)-4-hydroxy-3-methylbut-2-enyl-diphosphate synthase [Spirochaetaceae bacterium]|jgi:(E)-4-hydroxy-3-methylbut-2-enyl-diphosphate synthase|nr:(E)-4-hydroxy-3-methylbut-2-enyl-diphosphate synthase [Spirochaetaceae bacterium]
MTASILRKNTKAIVVGGKNGVNCVIIGGGRPVVIQTMWKDAIADEDLADGSILKRIKSLAELGAQMIRFAAPDIQQARVLGELASKTDVPVVADIHFDYKIALCALDYPISKLRINPGNIGSKERVRAVLEKAAAKGVPIRIGVNGGSLPLDLRAQVNSGALAVEEALVTAAERELAVFREARFENVCVSVKASSVAQTIAANRLLAERTDVPVHLGVTEAGPLIAGVARNAAALYTLLCEGIGDTIRASISGDMESEIIAAREIIGSVYERGVNAENNVNTGVRLISCPRCGRCGFDTHGFTAKWQNYLYSLKKNITVAVMGCAVNGPEEGKRADLGITGAGDKTLIFKKGVVVRTINKEDADEAFKAELDGL